MTRDYKLHVRYRMGQKSPNSDSSIMYFMYNYSNRFLFVMMKNLNKLNSSFKAMEKHKYVTFGCKFDQ